MKSLVAAAALLALAGAAQAQATHYQFDPTHTFANFEIGHMGTSTIRGRFDRKQGSAQIDRAAKAGRIDVTLEAGSISTGVAPFDKHLQSADFFNVAQFPNITFTSDKLVFAGDKLSEVTGTLVLLGKALPVTLKATRFNCYESPMIKREVCGGDFETTIKRSQWGMNWGLNFGAPDDVRLLVQVEGIKQ
ncbi:YceI family protein [Pseudorhodoferax sp.]|uniref:YceI family protein n=1 Tax=Pseudorhodoferax sp. TaxID=1993553 RepID=UPI002DD686EF|nr:YceI family protein [Pseudorhodoferax sp.]